eukprot:3130013-Ditylum_brightwellii.AAC.1
MSRTELDSSANMPCMGKDALVVSDTGMVTEVNLFTPDCDAMKVKSVDAALKNALHVPSLVHNLIPPFVLIEVGIKVNDTPKIHKENPTVDDHAITFPGEGLRITLGLLGVFSYFPTFKPSIEEVNTSKSVYILAPNRWNPHAKQYANCEKNLINWGGNVLGMAIEMTIVLADIPDDEGMAYSMMIAITTMRYMDALEMDDGVVINIHPKCQIIPHDANK